jgi:hypothetical protein
VTPDTDNGSLAQEGAAPHIRKVKKNKTAGSTALRASDTRGPFPPAQWAPEQSIIS